MANRRRLEPVSVATLFSEMRQDYDAGRTTRYRRTPRGVRTSGSSADYHYRSPANFYYAIEMARDLVRNNNLIGQGIRRLVANVIQGGFVLDVRTGKPELDDYLAAKWTDWSTDAAQCDKSGERNFNAIEKALLKAQITDGDCAVNPLADGSLELIEGHLIKTPTGTRLKNVVMGVKLGPQRQREEYWVSNQDISPTQQIKLVGDIRQLPTMTRDPDTGEVYRSFFHIYDPDRISQTRGVSALLPAVNTAFMGDDIFFAKLVQSQLASCYTIFREMSRSDSPATPGSGDKPQRGTRETEPRPDGSTQTIEGAQPGLEVFGYEGEKMHGFSPNIPNAEFFQHAMLILQVVAVNLDLPLQVFLLDPTKTNFSGWRGAMDQARIRFKDIQGQLITRFHKPCFELKVRQWLADDPILQRLAADPAANVYGHRWGPPGWPYIEPHKDATSDVVRLSNALISDRRRCAERGMIWDDLSTEIVDDRALFVVKAFEKATKINAANPGLDITWRELAPLPMPTRVKLAPIDPTPPDETNETNETEPED